MAYYSRDPVTELLGEEYGTTSNLNKSYQSTTSHTSSHITGANTNSKAVLAALRALQEKIRRLESERSQALDESQELRHQLKSLEIEAEHAKQKENLAAQRNLQEARAAYDRLQHEKVELELRLSKLEESNKLAQHHSDELQLKIKDLEEEKYKNLLRTKELESQNMHIESQIGNAQEYEKDLAHNLAKESHKHEQEIHSLTTRIKSLQKELDKTYEERGYGHQKVKELDKLIGQLLSVNEALVEQLSGKINSRKMMETSATSAAAAATSKKGIPSSSLSSSISKSSVRKPSLVPRVANISTAANDAYKTTKVPTKKMVPIKTDEIENLQKLHRKYSEMANLLLEKRPLSSSKSSPSSRSSPSSLLRPRSKSMEGGNYSMNTSVSAATTDVKSVRKSRGRTPTRLSRKKNTSMERQPLTSQEVFGTDLRETKFDVSSRRSHDNESMLLLNESTDTQVTAKSTGMKNVSMDSSRPILPSSSSSSLHRNKANTDLAQVIDDLEQEFDSLNKQYRRLLGSVQNEDTNNETERAEELISVIQKLHKKGEQLRALKSPTKLNERSN